MNRKNPDIPVSKLDDEDMRAVPAALFRAAKRAHEIARQAGTGVVIEENGKTVIIEPDPPENMDAEPSRIGSEG